MTTKFTAEHEWIDTANLDAATETDLLESICALPGGKIFVTHSERLLHFVDRAYRLEQGVLRPVDRDGMPPALDHAGRKMDAIGWAPST